MWRAESWLSPPWAGPAGLFTAWRLEAQKQVQEKERERSRRTSKQGLLAHYLHPVEKDGPKSLKFINQNHPEVTPEVESFSLVLSFKAGVWLRDLSPIWLNKECRNKEKGLYQEARLGRESALLNKRPRATLCEPSSLHMITRTKVQDRAARMGTVRPCHLTPQYQLLDSCSCLLL